MDNKGLDNTLSRLDGCKRIAWTDVKGLLCYDDLFKILRAE